MFCTWCGNAESDDAVYCSRCGAPLASRTPATQSAGPVDATQVMGTTAGPNLGLPEKHLHTRAWPQAEARPSPQGDPILRADGIPKPPRGPTGPDRTRSLVGSGRLRSRDPIAGQLPS